MTTTADTSEAAFAGAAVVAANASDTAATRDRTGAGVSGAVAARRLPIRLGYGSTGHWVVRAACMAMVTALVLWVPLTFPKFRILQLTDALIVGIAIIGLNVLTGYTGQISIGHSAFYGLGSYTAGVLIAKYDWHYAATIPVALVLCFVLGAISGLPALRITGLNIALVTLGIGLVFPTIVKRFDGITEGAQGLDIPRPTFPGYTRQSDHLWWYWVAIGGVVLSCLLVRSLVRSRAGRSLIAVRDNPTAAATSGVNVAQIRIISYGLASALAGFAGALHAFRLRTLSPDEFSLLKSIEFLTGMVVGGVATIAGPIIGGLAVVFIPYYTSELGEGAISGVFFGGALIFLMFVAPGGVMGLWRKLRMRLLVVAPKPPTRFDTPRPAELVSAGDALAATTAPAATPAARDLAAGPHPDGSGPAEDTTVTAGTKKEDMA